MEKVRWVIQSNLISEKDLNRMRDALQHFSIKFEEVKIIPFSGDLPKITFDHHINIYYGSTTFMYNVYKRLSKPVGLFFDEQSFTMENYLKQ